MPPKSLALVSLVSTLIGFVAAESQPVSSLARVTSNTALRFEPNLGQAPENVQYVARGVGYTLALSGKAASVSFGHGDASCLITMTLNGASARSRAEVGSPLGGLANYYAGAGHDQWLTGVPNYGQVRFHSVYPKIDLVYYGKDGKLEYDFIAEPGSSPENIRLAFSGADSLTIDSRGDLVIQAGGQIVRQRKPVVYQEISGQRVEVSGGYRIVPETDEVRFVLGSYDERHRLVIDPVLLYSSDLGGSLNDLPAAIAVDSEGSVYVTGSTSAGFPKGGNEDVFVSKLSPSGEVIYTTHVGGGGADRGLAIAVDRAGNAYVTGSTTGDFPTLNAYQPSPGGGTDAFLLKLDPQGNLAYSSYVGGSGNDRGNGIAVDSKGSIVIAGSSTGAFPMVNALRQAPGTAAVNAFVAKFNASGTPAYSTYLGSAGESSANGLAVDSSGFVYVTGEVSGAFPVTNAAQAVSGGSRDAFAVKLNAAGTPVYATFLGGVGSDSGRAIGVDWDGSAYIAGSTTGSFPMLNASQDQFGGGASDTFLAKLDAEGSRVYATYLGGAGSDLPLGLAVRPFGEVYVTGMTADGIRVKGQKQRTATGHAQGFLARFGSSGEVLNLTHFGGAGNEYGLAVAVDGSGAVYMAGKGSAQALRSGDDGGSGDPNGSFIAKLASLGPQSSTSKFAGIVPDSAVVGSGDFELYVSGSAFHEGAVVRWNGAPLATTSMGDGKLTALVPAALLVSEGPVSVTVANPGEASTSTSVFWVTKDPSVPVFLGSARGSSTLTARFRNLQPGATFRLNGVDVSAKLAHWAVELALPPESNGPMILLATNPGGVSSEPVDLSSMEPGAKGKNGLKAATGNSGVENAALVQGPIRQNAITSNQGSLIANDDDSSALIQLRINNSTVNFFGVQVAAAYVDNNGYITFTNPPPTGTASYTPSGLASWFNQPPIVAPFYADVDTQGLGSGIVTYGNGAVSGHAAFIVNWPGVGYYSAHSDLLNNFQLVLIDRADTGTGNFDIEFNYGQVLWESGDSTTSGLGQRGTNGIGGLPVHVGYSNGQPQATNKYTELAGSGVSRAFLDSGPTSTRLISNSFNSGGVAGRYVFPVRNGTPNSIVVNTNPTGLNINVDSVTAAAPQTYSWVPGSSHTIATTTPQQASGTRYVFSNWSDTGALSHAVQGPSVATTFTANFTTQYLLTTAVSPASCGSVAASPSSADGYYNPGTVVQLTATPAANCTFLNWTGDLSGATNPQSVTMSAPRSVTANFSVGPTCTYALSPGGASTGNGAGSGTVNVIAPSGCAWTAASPVAWVNISTPASGSGNGTVTYNVGTNSASTSRSTSLTIAGLPFSLLQAGGGCVAGLSPSSFSLGSNGSAGSSALTLSGSDCAWAASSTFTWLHLTGSASGTGNGTVGFTADLNPNVTSRTGLITVTGLALAGNNVITITQSGATCAYSLPIASQAFSSSGGSGSAAITATGGCTWSASVGANSSWITINGPSTGSGNGLVPYAVAANSSQAPRTGTLGIGGLTYTITQAAVATTSVTCTPSVPSVANILLEGRTEIVGDLVLTCTGLTAPTTVDISLSLDTTNVSNTITDAGRDTVDATLQVNGGSGVRGKLVAANSVRWIGVVLPSGGSSTSVRITGLRADASLLPPSSSGMAALTGTVLLFSPSRIVLLSPQQTLARAATSLLFQSGSAAGGTQPIIPLRYQEVFATAFNAAGSFPTRLRMKLTNIPANVQVFAPVFPAEGNGMAQLYSADADGKGGGPVTGSPLAGVTYQQLTIANGSAVGTWVVLASDSNRIDNYTFPLLLQNPQNVDLSAIKVAGSLAPVSIVSGASSTETVPRYRDFSVPQSLVPLRVTSRLQTPITAQVPPLLKPGIRAAFSSREDTYQVGSNVTYLHTVLNDSSDTMATSVVVRDSLPAGLIYQNCTAEGGTCSRDGNDVRVVYQSLSPGSSRNITVVAKVDPSLGDGTVVSNSVSGAADQINPDVNSGTASSSFSVAGGTNVSLQMTHSDPFSGSTGTYTITVSNSGQVGLLGGTLTETVPTGLTLLSLSGSDWNCSGNTCTQKPTAIGTGQSSQITATVSVNTSTTMQVVNQVSLTAPSLSSPLTASDTTVVVVPTTNAFFVRQQYRDLLNREPDPGGLNYWTGLVDTRVLTRATVASSFFTSPEFADTGLYLIKLYIAVLGRDPDFGGWNSWFAGFRAGTPLSAILNAFLSGPEFQNTYGGLTNAQFVDLVYRNVLGRPPDSGGLANWLGQLNANVITRAQMMDAFIRGPEFDNRIRPRAFANLCYMGFLRRTADPDGLIFWTGRLQAGSPLTDVLNGFISSPEYLLRLGQIIQLPQ